MARRTDGEKIDELDKLAATFTERLNGVRKELDALGVKTVELSKRVEEARTSIALLQREIEQLRKENAEIAKAQDQASSRGWSILLAVVGAVLSGIISFVVASLVAKK